MIKRFLAKLLTTAVVGLVAVSAHASRDFYYEGTIYGASGPLGTYRTPLVNGSIYKPMADAQQAVMSQLRTYLLPPLKDTVAQVPGYQSGYAAIDGPLTLSYSNGEVAFSGMRVTLNAVVKKSMGALTATCNVNLVLDPATTIVGQLDIATGTLAAKEIRNFKLNPSYSCETNLDWIPVVNLLVDAAITHYADQLIADYMQVAYNKLGEFNQLTPMTFVGLNAIPDSVFGTPGLSLTQLKNRIASGFQNLPDMTLVIGDPKRRVFGPQGYPHEAGSHDLVMSISVGDIRFELGEHRIYYDEMYCPPAGTGRACMPF